MFSSVFFAFLATNAHKSANKGNQGIRIINRLYVVVFFSEIINLLPHGFRESV